jgi:prolyl 4-hydroxylase
MFNVYREPKIINNFLTDDECEYLIKVPHKILDMSREQFQQFITNIKNEKAGRPEEDKRTLKCINDNDPISISIRKRCSEIVNKPIKNFEPLQMIKYQTHGFYGEHNDSNMHIRRLYTFIFALNDDYEGGETYFPKMKKQFKLKKGDALLFHNFTTDGQETPLSTHGGKMVTSGEKWIANLWVRQHPYA